MTTRLLAGVEEAAERRSAGVVFYYSGTGNTALACGYIARRLPLPMMLVDVTRPQDAAPTASDLAAFEVVGFATSTDFWGVPRAFEEFIERLPAQNAAPAFVFNTYGAASGKTLRILDETVSARGFSVVTGHSLRMPESYPPMIAARMGAKGAPGRRQLARLDSFVADLSGLLTRLQDDQPVERRRLHLGPVNALLPRRPRTTARDGMGEKSVDDEACTTCGTCARGCPYEAIRLAPAPCFDMERCHGCWRCYNRCPTHAISTQKFRDGPYYAAPGERLTAKLGA